MKRQIGKREQVITEKQKLDFALDYYERVYGIRARKQSPYGWSLTKLDVFGHSLAVGLDELTRPICQELGLPAPRLMEGGIVYPDILGAIRKIKKGG